MSGRKLANGKNDDGHGVENESSPSFLLQQLSLNLLEENNKYKYKINQTVHV